MSSGGSSVRVDRVVAVAATLRDGREQLGSGYLISGRLVLTAEHCTRDKVTGEPAARLRVVRASDGAVAEVAGVVPDHGLDVAVLQLADDAPWDADLPPPAFARVDQSQSGVLDDCTGIGFPLFQRDPDRRTRHTSEFHGRIYQTDERESGRLLMREPLIHPGPVTGPEGEALSEPGRGGTVAVGRAIRRADVLPRQRYRGRRGASPAPGRQRAARDRVRADRGAAPRSGSVSVSPSLTVCRA